MKLVTLLFFALTFSIKGTAQDTAELRGDTIHYGNSKFYVGQIVRLGYGSNGDKSFAFAVLAQGFYKGFHLDASWAKTEILITELLQKGTSIGFEAVSTGKKKIKIRVDVDKAIDPGELQRPSDGLVK